MYWITELVMIAYIIAFITNISGIVEYIKKGIWLFLYGRRREYREFNIKLLECSLCQTWWIGLGWIAWTGRFSLPGIFTVAVIAFMSDTITHSLYTIKDVFTRVFNLINK